MRLGVGAADTKVPRPAPWNDLVEHVEELPRLVAVASQAAVAVALGEVADEHNRGATRGFFAFDFANRDVLTGEGMAEVLRRAAKKMGGDGDG